VKREAWRSDPPRPTLGPQPGLLENIIERLKAEFQPEEIYLFGSHA